MDPAILVIDTGSSSMRGIVYTPQGQPLVSARRSYTMDLGPDVSAVMDAAVFDRCLREVVREAVREADRLDIPVGALALDSQRSSVLAVDRDMQPLHPILMWYDKRCVPLCREVEDRCGAELYRQCGMRLTPVSSAPKMAYLRQTQPEIYRRAHKLIGIHDYLLYLCTGRLVTDVGCACRTALMDIRTFRWSPALLDCFGLDGEKLPEDLLPSGSVVGGAAASFCRDTGLTPGIPVISAGGDQQCCVLGLEAPAGALRLNSGSASYMALPVTQPRLDPRREVNLSAYCGPEPWVLEASNTGSGTVYNWFTRSFYGGDLEAVNREVAAAPPGCDGLICLADFAGRGCPATDPAARGMFLGAGLQHTRGSFARSVLEGICFGICEALDQIRALGAEAGEICSAGGLANFPVFNQILADISGLPVLAGGSGEATAQGALLLARQALSLAPPPPASDRGEVCLPDPEHSKIYRGIAEIRQKVYQNLSSSTILFQSNSL